MPTTPLHEQYFQDLSPLDLTRLHLEAANPQKTRDYAVISTLAVTEMEVRHALAFERSRSIIPIMGMMAIIEQLGEAYRRTDMAPYPNADASSLKKSLYYFSGQAHNNDFTKTLYGLRNGIVHNASFHSIGKNTQPNYIFTYDRNTPNVFVPATTAWDGNFNNMSMDYFTVINPQRLLDDVVQKCMDSVRQASLNGTLEIALPGGQNELIFRYFKWKAV